ncbi:MAG: hypothetical protein ACRDF9_06335, partial [Candidatus Limnocylindria bacterium]
LRRRAGARRARSHGRRGHGPRAARADTRQLWGNPNPFAASGLPAERPIELTIIWVVVLVAIFAPLGVLRYRSMSR